MCDEPDERMRILFLCTGNSCRSQMAEGWARFLRGDRILPFSAGIRADGMNPLTVAVMSEAGVDISSQYSKKVLDVMDGSYNCVITLCGHARETCPVFPGETTLFFHRGFEDPAELVIGVEDREERLEIYRRIRDLIREFVLSLPDSLPAVSGEQGAWGTPFGSTELVEGPGSPPGGMGS